MRNVGIALLLAGLLLIAGSVFLHLKTGSLGVTPEAVIAMEQKLARPGLIALATLNVDAMVELAESDPEGQAWNEPFEDAGIDLANDISHATLALTAHESGDPRAAVALFGSFDPAAIEQALRDSPEIDVASGQAGGESVLHLQRTDPETCEESGPWALHLDGSRLLLAHTEEIGALLGAADPAAAGALRDLTRFQAFRAGQLVSGAFFIPDELPTTDNFMVAMAAQAAKAQVHGFRAFYAGASPQIVPPGLEIDAFFEGVDAATTEQKLAAWQAAIETFRGSLAESMPTLAEILAALELHAEGVELHAQMKLSKGQLEKLQALPGELGSSMFGGMTMTMDTGEAPQEQIDENPLAFLVATSGAALAAYDPEVAFAGKADETSGPVGVRLSAARLLPSDGRTELEVEAFATNVPNLGDLSERVFLEITNVEGKGGQELLAAEICGPDRNDKPAAFSSTFGGEVLSGTKKVRIREGATADGVARIVGQAKILLPVRTESVRVPAAEGETLERAGARLEITKAGGGSFSYDLTGETQRLLHLRALNAQGRPLSGAGSTTSTLGAGKSGSRQFAGTVHEIEAVFALEEEELRFPFALGEARPGSDGETLAQKTSEPVDAETAAMARGLENMLDQLAGQMAQAVERVVDGSDQPLARQRAGPFVVTLESIWAFGGLMPRLEVMAPEIPGVAGNPTAIQLSLDEIRMRDGSRHAGPWAEVLQMGQGFGKPGLTGSAQLRTGAEGSAEDVQSIAGRVTIRLPEQVGTQRFASTELGAGVTLPGLEVALVELGRDRFTLRASSGGERVLGARAFNAFGEELWMPDSSTEQGEDGTLALSFRVTGVPAEIELRYAEKLSSAEYPFVLAKGDSEVARAN